MLVQPSPLAARFLSARAPSRPAICVGRLFAGIDLREHGSGNLGATNLYRVLGWKYAVPVGAVRYRQGRHPGPASSLPGCPTPSCSRSAAAWRRSWATCSRCSSDSREGRGWPPRRASCWRSPRWPWPSRRWSGRSLVWLTGYVSLGSIAAAAVFPVAVYLLEHPDRAGAALDRRRLMAAAIIVLHRRNIQRLLKGTENRFGRRAASAPPAMTPRRGAGRGQLGHHPGQPAGAQGRDGAALGLRAGSGRRRSTGRHENPVFLPGIRARARRSAPSATPGRRWRAPR